MLFLSLDWLCHMHFPVLSSFMTYDWVWNWSNTTGATSATITVYTSRAHKFIPSFRRVYVIETKKKSNALEEYDKLDHYVSHWRKGLRIILKK
jgi:hypothetical protein